MRSPRNPGPDPGVATVSGDAAAASRGARVAGTTVARRFAATCLSVGQARRFLLEQLGGGGGDDIELMALMVSELATNAMQHAETDFEVEISVTPDIRGRCVHVRVTDDAPGFPTPQEPAADAPHGRGLRIVASLADAWGIEMHRGSPGKTVWFTSLVRPADEAVVPAARRIPAGAGGGA